MITALRRFIAGLLGGLISIVTLRLVPVNRSGRQAISDPSRDDEHAAKPASPQRPR